jgi:hypothetical protein
LEEKRRIGRRENWVGVGKPVVDASFSRKLETCFAEGPQSRGREDQFDVSKALLKEFQ